MVAFLTMLSIVKIMEINFSFLKDIPDIFFWTSIKC